MNSIAFQSGHYSTFTCAAMQQRLVGNMPNAATANDDQKILDKPAPYAARGIIFGFVIAVPMWVLIAEMTSLACGAIG